MQRGFTKLFNTIVTSTIWQEDDKTRIVWITMLAIADAQGVVGASIPGLASVANVSVDSARVAVAKLEGPDPDSRTEDFEGRRIEKIEGGWHILNYTKYMRMLSEDERREYKAKWIADKRRQTSTVDKSRKKSSLSTQAEGEAEADKKGEGSNGSSPASVEDWLKELEADKTYQGISVRTEYGKMLNWCKVHGKQATKRRFVNWLNRSEKPLSDKGWKPGYAKPYGRNYSPAPAPDISDEERARFLKIAAEEKEKLRHSLQSG